MRAVTVREDMQRGELYDCPRHSLKRSQEANTEGSQVEPGGPLLVGETVLEVQKSQDDESSEGRNTKAEDSQSANYPGMCRGDAWASSCFSRQH